MAENMGLKTLAERFNEEEMEEYFAGIFLKDHPKNTKYVINFFTSIGLGALTVELRKFLKQQQLRVIEERKAEILRLEKMGALINQSGSETSNSEDESGSESESGS